MTIMTMVATRIPDPGGGSRSSPVSYRGIRMSRLAACYALFLDGHRVSWVYQPARFQFGSDWWTPDFRIMHGGGPGYVMVRAAEQEPPPFPPFADVQRVDGLLLRLESAWASDPLFGLTLVFMRADGTAPSSQAECRGPGFPWWWRFIGERAVYSIWPGLGQLVTLRRAAEQRTGQDQARPALERR